MCARELRTRLVFDESVDRDGTGAPEPRGQVLERDYSAEDLLRRAVDQHFRGRAVSSRWELRQLLRIGRRSLIIGVLGLAVSIGASELVAMWAGESPLGQLFANSLLIGGWVAMWRPLEIFLYDWWPIRADARLFDRLSAIPVTVVVRDG